MTSNPLAKGQAQARHDVACDRHSLVFRRCQSQETHGFEEMLQSLMMLFGRRCWQAEISPSACSVVEQPNDPDLVVSFISSFVNLQTTATTCTSLSFQTFRVTKLAQYGARSSEQSAEIALFESLRNSIRPSVICNRLRSGRDRPVMLISAFAPDAVDGKGAAERTIVVSRLSASNREQTVRK